MVWNLFVASSQQRDLRLSGPPIGQGVGSGTRTRNRRVSADLRAGSIFTVPPMFSLTGVEWILIAQSEMSDYFRVHDELCTLQKIYGSKMANSHISSTSARECNGNPRCDLHTSCVLISVSFRFYRLQHNIARPSFCPEAKSSP
ncbi:hypothetical protein PoB_004324200 [Plakobranchus ocellatus]|uniref:Uncharacterized protein n=1 Tax=Plakobranchus ocellatus TaxID=259542 RepID=A0AAV4BC22_9GAST|nr:hypothetical protein PoB_004324200 [Plakobranchus ocellatus]